MQPGDLIFIRGTEGVAGPIKKITQSPYTHIAGLVVNDQLFESQALRKTGYQTVETYRGVSDIYTCHALSNYQRCKIVDFVMERMGTRYDYLLFGFLAFRHVFGDAIPLYASKKRQICTTLWADAYKAAGIDLCPNVLHPTPGELSKSESLQYAGSY